MGRSMQRLHCRFFIRALLIFGLATVLNELHGCPPARAAEQQSSLALDVTINGAALDAIGTFVRFPGGMIGATRSELESLGLRASAAHTTGDMVMLNDIPSLKYVYEERAQRIRITVDDAYRLPHVFDLGSTRTSIAGWLIVGHLAVGKRSYASYKQLPNSTSFLVSPRGAGNGAHEPCSRQRDPIAVSCLLTRKTGGATPATARSEPRGGFSCAVASF